MANILDSLRSALADRYQIDRELGRGGMALVFLAHDLKHHRPVAIKVLRPEVAQALGAERFLREIEIATRLTHPHILAVHDSGEASGLLYYVMPYVEGESLRHRLDREQQLPVDKAVDIARQVASALSYAHGHDVVHRDIKPENILLAGDEVVVADFGIARAISAVDGEQLTSTGIAVGTAAYMSPEQGAGEPHLDGRSDVFSLGCVLYEMLAGAPPFTGPTAQAIQARRMTDPVPPLRTVRETVPAHVEQAIIKALAKVPADRFASALEFSDALGVSHDRKARRRNRIAVRSGITVAVALLILLSAYLVTLRRGTDASGRTSAPRTRLVVLPFDNLGAPEDEYFADGITEEITSRLTQLSGLGVIARTSAMQYKKTAKTVRQIGEELGVQYVLEGTVRWEKEPDGTSRVRVSPQLIRVSDATHVWAEPYEAPLAGIFRLQSDVAERVAEAMTVSVLDPERTAIQAQPTKNLQAYGYYLRGNGYFFLPAPERDTRLAIEMYEQAVGLDSTFALAYAKLSIAHGWMFWVFYDRSDRRLADARRAMERAALLQPDLLESHLARGYLYHWGNRDYGRALQEFAIAQRQQPNNAEVVSAIGWVHRRQGGWQQTIEDLSRAIALDPRAPEMYSELGLVHQLLRNYPEAQRLRERALSLAPDRPSSYFNLAGYWLVQGGDVSKIRQVMSQGAKRLGVEPILRTMLGSHEGFGFREGFGFTEGVLPFLDQQWQLVSERFQDTAQSPLYFFAKAELYARERRSQRARAYYDSLRVVSERFSRGRPTEAEYHALLGIADAGLGRKTEAIREGLAAVELLPVTKDALSGPRLQINLARIYCLTGEQDKAIDRLEYLLTIPSEISVPRLRVEPAWDMLRGNPRFQKLVAKQN
jgi:serine/threonine-protein kinase